MNKNYDKVTIGKGKEKRKIPKTYLPKTLSKEDKKKQEKSILEEKKRPKLESFESRRSPFIIKFEQLYNNKITNKKFIHDNLLSYAGQKQVIEKGMSAYFNSGSRPNQTSTSWALARLASVLVGGKAQRIDKDIVKKYGKGKLKQDVIKKYFES